MSTVTEQSHEAPPGLQSLVLPAAGRNGQARVIALSTAPLAISRPTSLVEYRSRGRVLVIGAAARAVPAAETLRGSLQPLVLVTDGTRPEDSPVDSPVPVILGQLRRLTGHFGAFDAIVESDGQALELSALGGEAPTLFDLVLDLRPEAGPWTGTGQAPEEDIDASPIHAQVPPVGYFAPGGSNDLAATLSALEGLVGTFEKPKFFDYDPDICAHGAAGMTACRRCIEACPTLAIHSAGEHIKVDPYLCQGGGSCATACPSGAITYAYPAANDLLDRVRELLRAYREADGRNACILFFGGEALSAHAEDIPDARDGAWVGQALHSAPESVLPVQVEEIGSVGMDVWLTALAYGAEHVALCVPGATPKVVARELDKQADYARAILEGMGYAGDRITVLKADDAPTLSAGLQTLRSVGGNAPAAYATFNEKRRTIRFAVEHLYELAEVRPTSAPLPAGAPFGEVLVDRDACTLCMACVSVCPASALADGGELPQLKFVEANCVQCGLCSSACPERAITLASRMAYQYDLWRSNRVLHEEKPFACVVCGKSFATQAMMRRMAEKLSGHWMFQDEAARRRLQMCEDCRVADIHAAEGGAKVHR